MCFTPAISLTTAIIEWILAIILFTTFRKSKLAPLFSLLLVLLGGYQFSEYMLCTTNSLFWVTFGFICYSFLPAVGLHSILNYFHQKKYLWLLYAVPVLFSLFAVMRADFAIYGQCLDMFVQVTTLLTESPVLWTPYALYYGGFIIVAFIFLWKAHRKARTNLERKIYDVEMLGILLMTIPTFTLIMIFPPLGILFPSILCHFALLLAILFFWGAYLDEEKSLHKKFHQNR